MQFWRALQVGQDAFAVIRDTVAKMNMVALGRVVLTRREHVIALEPRDRGLLGLTLRYSYEVRDQAEYFEDIPELTTWQMRSCINVSGLWLERVFRQATRKARAGVGSEWACRTDFARRA